MRKLERHFWINKNGTAYHSFTLLEKKSPETSDDRIVTKNLGNREVKL